jgi:hypothetical protein
VQAVEDNMARDQILSENVTFFSVVIILPLLLTHFWSRSQNSENRLLASSHSSFLHQKMRRIKYTYNIKMSCDMLRCITSIFKARLSILPN